ncbi:MAG TPA: MBL fold metallo-hydrolase [Dongiaceae bacterium]|nr:MBL fold metallo-hydrolase [Dongiaceae bacterium]
MSKGSKGIEIPDNEVVSLESVAPGLFGLHIMLVNVYAITTETGWVLIDAGLPMSASRIRRWAESQFTRHKPSMILLTHGHFDHVGALPDLAEQWDVPVYAHELELPYLRGKAKYPPPDASAGGGLMSLLAPFYPRGPVNLGERVQPFASDGKIPGLDDWRWIHTPGHTEGHVSLFRHSDQCLLVGDAFCTTKQESVLAIAKQKPELHGPPAYYTSDWDAAKASVEHLATLKPHTVAPGHGSPMTGPDVAPALDKLAANFDEIARPHHERRAA